MFGFDQDDGFDADGEKLPGRSFAAAFAHVARKTADVRMRLRSCGLVFHRFFFFVVADLLPVLPS